MTLQGENLIAILAKMSHIAQQKNRRKYMKSMSLSETESKREKTVFIIRERKLGNFR